jgi:hypothetical protein
MDTLHPAKARIALSGDSGFIGAHLHEWLSVAGHSVIPIKRRTVPGRETLGYPAAAGTSAARSYRDVDVVIHLAGESIFGRWTAARKRAIRSSRVELTGRLAQALAALDEPPRLFITASAVGYYGDRGTEVLTEHSDSGNGFLASVCSEWEAAVQPAEQAGIRCVQLRLGVILSPQGGALAQMLPLFKLGLGGRLGSGEQYFPWLAREELGPLVAHIMSQPKLSGPVNFVAPEPVTNRQFTAALAGALHRPIGPPVPAWALRLGLGQLATEGLLASQRVVPAALLDSGYIFRHHSVEEYLAQAFSD